MEQSQERPPAMQPRPTEPAFLGILGTVRADKDTTSGFRGGRENSPPCAQAAWQHRQMQPL